MKFFLQICKGTYINAERIDLLTCSDGELKIFVGGCDKAWTVDEPYAGDILEFVQSNFWILSKKKK